MTDANYAYDLALLANTPAQARSLPHSLVQESGSIDLKMNASKQETISSDKLPKLIDQFTYLGSNISSTESDVNICIEKVWNDIRKKIVGKSYLSDQIKWDFFQAMYLSVLLYECTLWTLTKSMEKK